MVENCVGCLRETKYWQIFFDYIVKIAKNGKIENLVRMFKPSQGGNWRAYYLYMGIPPRP